MKMFSLEERAQSSFPVSLPTGLALETLFDPIMERVDNERQVEKIDVTTYDLFLVNIDTLIRNILNSVPTAELYKLNMIHVCDTLLAEIAWMTDFCESNGIPIQFYYNTYKYVHDLYDKDHRVRKPTTDKQLYLDGIYKYCQKKLAKQDNVIQTGNDIKVKDVRTVLIFTHIPWDLLSHRHYSQMDLLESHTGLIKTRKDWNSKYYKMHDFDFSFLPFFEHLLVTFGDNAMFKPASVQERTDLYNVLRKKNVHPLMSEMTFAMMHT